MSQDEHEAPWRIEDGSDGRIYVTDGTIGVPVANHMVGLRQVAVLAAIWPHGTAHPTSAAIKQARESAGIKGLKAGLLIGYLAGIAMAIAAQAIGWLLS